MSNIQYRQTHQKEIKAYQKAYYEKHKVIERARQDKVKARPCMDCGNLFPPECMDFDHVRGEKKFEMAHAINSSQKTFEQEVAKCDIVCANCHRIRTRKRGMNALSPARSN